MTQKGRSLQASMRALPLVAGVTVLLLGIAVMCGWWLGWRALVQLDPGFAPMQFNTALTLALLGTATLCAARARRKWVAVLAAAAMIIPLLTLAQYATGASFGIDTLFIDPFTTTKTSHPGRMAPTTALCAVACALALLLHGPVTKSTWRAVAGAACAAFALGISSSTLMGYLFGLDASYGWAELTRMALHTAAALALLSAAASVLPAAGTGDRRDVAVWLNGTVGVALVVMVLTFWQILRDNQRMDMQRVLAARSEQIAEVIRQGMSHQRQALRRMASRWVERGGTPEAEWRADAREYVRDDPSLRAVEWVDDALRIRWVEPVDGNEVIIGAPAEFDSQRTAELQQVIGGRATRISPVIDLRQGGRGVLIQSPLFVQNRFDGVLVSVVQIDRLLDDMLDPLLAQGFAVAITDGDRILAGSPGLRAMPDAIRRTLTLNDGVQWDIAVAPAAQSSRALGIAMSDLLLVVSLLLCAAMLVAFHFAQRARNRGAALETERSRLSDVIRATNVGTWEWEIGTGVVAVNERWARMLGYALGDVAPLSVAQWRELTHPEDLPRIEHAAGEHLAGRSAAFEGDYRLRHRDGRWIWVRARGRVVRTASDGRPLLMSGTNTDISDRKTIEESLRLSQRRFSQAFETAAQGMALVGIDDTWVEVNASLCRLLGYPRDELLTLASGSIVYPDDLAEHRRLTDEVIAGTRDDYLVEQRYLHRDGHPIWVLLSASLVRDDAAEPLYFIFQLLDITSRKRIDDMKAQFVSTVSHELRTPLTSISGALGLVLGGALGEMPEAMRGMLAVARQNSDRLNQLINDLLDLEKLEAGLLPIQPTRASLRAETEMAVAVNQGYADRLGVRFVIAAADEGDAEVDRLRLQQVLANLLSNAAKFSVASGTVTVTVRRHDRRVRISVHNDGAGIAPEFRGRIFQKFSQGDSADTRQKGGTGLGLAISKELVERMGGTIGFESEPDLGATFWVEFARVGAG